MAAGGGTLPGGGTALMCQVTVLGDPSVVPGVAAQDAAQWMSSWAVTDAQNTGWLLLIPFLPSSLGCLHKLSWIYIFNDRVLFFFFKGKQVLWHSSHITHQNRQCQILRTTKTVGIIQNIKPRQQHLTAGVVCAS